MACAPQIIYKFTSHVNSIDCKCYNMPIVVTFSKHTFTFIFNFNIVQMAGYSYSTAQLDLLPLCSNFLSKLSRECGNLFHNRRNKRSYTVAR